MGPRTHRLSVHENVPPSLVGDVELPAVLELDDALLARDLPRGTLQLQVHVHALVLSRAAQGDLGNKGISNKKGNLRNRETSISVLLAE